MAAYYRKEKILFTALGVLAGLALGLGWFGGKAGLLKLLTVLPVIAGALVGWRVFQSFAARKMKKYTDILFARVEPLRFLEEFGPILEKMPANSLDYVEGANKIAYAWEALGEFDRALACLDGLHPEQLGRASLGAMATTCSNRVRVRLLREDIPGAEAALEELREVTARAESKIPALGKSLRTYIRLYENWLLVLQGQEADTEYLKLEVSRSMNRIRQSEMQLLLARDYENQGLQEQADEWRIEALGTGKGLWAEGRARQLLGVK